MEQYYSNDSLTAFKTPTGIQIEEKKKASLKMLLVLLGLAVLVLIAGFLIGLFGGSIGRIMAPFLIWGAAIVLAIGIIAFIAKAVIPMDTIIIFDTTKSQVTVRKKNIAFSDIDEIMFQEQSMMGKTMTFAFMKINGKKKSLFSTGIVASDTKAMKEFVEDLDALTKKTEKTGTED